MIRKVYQGGVHMKNIAVSCQSEQFFEYFNSLSGREFKTTFLDLGQAKDYPPTFDFLFIEISDQIIQKHESIEQLIKNWKEVFFDIPILGLTKNKDEKASLQALSLGVAGLISPQTSDQDFKFLLKAAIEKAKNTIQIQLLQEKIGNEIGSDFFLKSKSSQMQSVLEQIQTVAQTKSTVLLTGESGTGKSFLANWIHQKSERSFNRFVSIHCGAIPETLIESELFGHEKGSFTGALKQKLGRFELADKGTLFLDEIGTISSQAQIKLLQVLQEKFIQRVGAETEIFVDVRIIAATNSPLQELVKTNQFREDLFYRLNVFPIEIPPLRKRKEDIPLLVENILKKLNGIYGKNINHLDSSVNEALINYSWPGNIRELENMIERAYILETSSTIGPLHFPIEIFKNSDSITKPEPDTLLPLAHVRANAVAHTEKQYLINLLGKYNGRVTEASKIAGISTRQIHKLINKYQINIDDFRK